MFRIIVFVVAVFVYGYADIKDQTIKTLESQSGRKLQVISVEQLKNAKLSLFVVQDKVSGYRTTLLADDDQKSIIVVATFFGTDKDDRQKVAKTLREVESYNFKLENSASLNALFKAIPNEYKITLQGKGNALTYIISDPMCPHCQDELNHIDSRLEKGSVVMIPVAFLGADSLKKSAEITEKIKSVQNNAEKISLLKQIYATTHQASEQSSQSTQQVQNVTKIIENSHLVTSVPFVYEAN
ncbi:hypothetical protein [uncultured Helicobacter sp.]|uniref:DsbA family protein n=1 Tax=uncultured Helicobacter sp. TaxID=175537 RepID=UPI002597D0DE|nr:hypothetical protein [uncultured Helicobacter sp.]